MEIINKEFYAHPYTRSTDLLYKRLVKLIPKHPEILELKSAFDLSKIKSFDLKGLDVTYTEVVAILDKVQQEHRETEKMED